MCITVDFDTLDKQLVTIRNRDTMKQESMEINLVADYFRNYFLS